MDYYWVDTSNSFGLSQPDGWASSYQGTGGAGVPTDGDTIYFTYLGQGGGIATGPTSTFASAITLAKIDLSGNGMDQPPDFTVNFNLVSLASGGSLFLSNNANNPGSGSSFDANFLLGPATITLERAGRLDNLPPAGSSITYQTQANNATDLTSVSPLTLQFKTGSVNNAPIGQASFDGNSTLNNNVCGNNCQFTGGAQNGGSAGNNCTYDGSDGFGTFTTCAGSTGTNATFSNGAVLSGSAGVGAHFTSASLCQGSLGGNCAFDQASYLRGAASILAGSTITVGTSSPGQAVSILECQVGGSGTVTIVSTGDIILDNSDGSWNGDWVLKFSKWPQSLDFSRNDASVMTLVMKPQVAGLSGILPTFGESALGRFTFDTSDIPSGGGEGETLGGDIFDIVF